MTYKLSATKEISKTQETSIIITVTIKTTNLIRITHATEIAQDIATDQLLSTTHHVQVPFVPIITHLDPFQH